ncbi:MAG TPA: hypothetical protein VIF10_04590 [Methylobacter sp.]
MPFKPSCERGHIIVTHIGGDLADALSRFIQKPLCNIHPPFAMRTYARRWRE